MKKFVAENYSFTITVIDRAKDGKRLHCRNGHEIGDSYICEYGCPMPTNGCGGFCSKTMMNLFRLKEIVYTGGDLRLLGFTSKTDIEFPCPDGAVWFRMQLCDLTDIGLLTVEHLVDYANDIRSYTDNTKIWYHDSPLELSVCAGQDILCRKATTADIEKMIQIDPIHRHEQICRAVIQDECYLAEETAQIVGFAIMDYSFFTCGFVSLLVVAEECRRRGIGAALLDYLLRQCKTGKLFTSTNESNAPMRGLLGKSGFMPCGQIDALDEGDPELFFVRKKAAR